MKKSERIISALVTVTLGVLLIAWQGDIINVLMTVLGISLLVLGVLDLIEREIKTAVLKLLCGVLAIAFCWLVVSVVSYVLAVCTVLLAVFIFYDYIKRGNRPCLTVASVSLWLKPICVSLIGLFLFFNDGGQAEWAFVVVGIFTVVLGGSLLLDVFIND